MPLADYINKHAGQTAWVFGKGPSFQTFDFSKAGPIRAAINDVAGHVPDLKYAFANDGVRAWRDLYRPEMVLFQPARCLHEFDSTQPGAVPCDVVTYPDTYNDNLLHCSPDRLAECLTIRRGTLGSLLQILYIMGIREAHLVGIDGGRAHADGIPWRTRLRTVHGKEYNAIRSEAIDAADILGIKLHFHNKHDDTMNDGKIKVQLTRDCFVDGLPYPGLAIISVSPLTARQLFGSNAATEYKGPEPQPAKVENAVKPMQAAESAALKATKTKHPRRK